MLRRIMMLVAVAIAMTATLVVTAAPAFAAHRCIVEPSPGATSCPDEHAGEGLRCATIASENRSPFLGNTLCTHL